MSYQTASNGGTTFRLEDYERMIRLIDEKPKPPFDVICVVNQLLKNPFVAPMIDGKKYLFIDRSMWSQIESQMRITPPAENNFMQGFGVPVIFQPEPQVVEDKTD